MAGAEGPATGPADGRPVRLLEGNMRVEVESGRLVDVRADAIVVGVFEGPEWPTVSQEVDERAAGVLHRIVSEGDFRGRLGDGQLVYPPEGMPAPRLLLLGLGKRERFDPEAMRRAVAGATKAAQRANLRRLALGVPLTDDGLSAAKAGAVAVEAALLTQYRFRAYKSGGAPEADEQPLETLVLVPGDGSQVSAVRQAAEISQTIAAGTCLARDMANHPGNVATPTYLAEQATAIAEREHLRCEIWDRDRIESEGMGAFASVARGSEESPRFIVLEHAPKAADGTAPIVLVGKGLTFDAGGINLKQGLKMATMKADMAGAAAVLGTMATVGALRLPVRVIGLAAATENLPSGRAAKPGDIVRARNGTTIEILNTDAEGRMVLADALAYAAELKPQAVVDVATLTGAIVVALGHHAAGIFSNDDRLADELLTAGEATGERLWRMPLWQEYGEAVKSEVADIRNASDSSPNPAGSIFGAKFLERFVDYPWAHLDIAGVFWDAPDVPYQPKGATGFGVRLLTEWLRGRA